MDRRVLYGPHYQTPIDDWPVVLDPINGIGIVKLVGNFEMARQIKEINPGAIVVIRHHHEDTGRWRAMAAESMEQAEAAMEEYVGEFLDSLLALAPFIDYAEGLNEQYPSHNLDELGLSVRLDRGFIRVLTRLCPSVKPVVFCAACGNPDHDEFEPLIPLAQECQAAGGAFGYHAYWSVVKKVSTVGSVRHMRDLHMRWAEIDRFLVDAGVQVDWFNGEAGPIGASAGGLAGSPNGGSTGSPTGGSTDLMEGYPDDFGYWQLCNDGWRDDDVWDGKIDGYIQDLEILDRLIQDTPAYREGRYLGYVLFTSSTLNDWKKFQLRSSDWSRLALHASQQPVLKVTEQADPIIVLTPTQSDYAVGIDVSQHQGEIDWLALVPEIQFAFIRASIGSGGVDMRFEDNWDKAACQGVPISPYHLFKPEQEAEPQVDNLLRVLDGRRPDFPPALDVELVNGQTPELFTSRLKRFLMLVESAGLGMPIIYTRADFWNKFLLAGSGSGLDLWVADPGASNPYLPSDWQSWRFWQYDWKGRLPGILGDALMDRFYGDAVMFSDFCQNYRELTGRTQQIVIRISPAGPETKISIERPVPAGGSRIMVLPEE